MANSELYICGEVAFEYAEIDRFVLSNVIRNIRTIAIDKNDNSIEKVEVTLFDQNNTVVWNGITDDLGKTSFNLTFTDSNYTDTLRLEAVKGNYSASMNVSFLSDTPIVLTMRYYTDLNADVAEPYDEINILDIATVAKDYGKTV